MTDASTLAELTEDVDAERFSSAVRGASDHELEELLASEHRGGILAEVFGQMPARLRRDTARGLDAVFEWRVGGRPGGGEDVYQVTVRDGECRVESGAASTPDVTLSAQPGAFLKLIAGAASPVKLVLARKLRVAGDLQLALRMERLFERS
jgi:putative sterol carrier protein